MTVKQRWLKKNVAFLPCFVYVPSKILHQNIFLVHAHFSKNKGIFFGVVVMSKGRNERKQEREIDVNSIVLS